MTILKQRFRTALIFSLCLYLSGCITAYTSPDTNADSAFVKLEKKSGKIPFGGVIMLLKVDDEFVCRVGKGITDQQKMAVLSRRSAAGQFNENGLHVEVNPKFRFMVRSVSVNNVEVGTWYADTSMCDVIFAFPTQKNQSYKILSSFDGSGCAVEVVAPSESGDPVELLEYKKC